MEDISKIELSKINGFKLLSLSLSGNTIMGKSSLYYNFLNPIDDKNSIYTTVLIGPNGTGKSNLFRIIIELFKELYDLKHGNKRSYNVDGRFRLKYVKNRTIYNYSNIPDNKRIGDKIVIPKGKGVFSYLEINGKRESFNKVELPLNIIASSIMHTDKFPFFTKKESFPIYSYIGVRSTPQRTSTQAYLRRTVETIVNRINSEWFMADLRKVVNFLGLEQSIKIIYYTINAPIFFKGNLTPEDFSNHFEEIKKRYEKSSTIPPFKLKYYQKNIKGSPSLIQKICDFCNDLVNKNILQKIPRSSGKVMRYDIMNKVSFSQLKEYYIMIEHLRELGMLYPPEMEIKKGDSEFSLNESSSGENHFINSVIGLLAAVSYKGTNNLIFIDEPEVSLHPNWQMRYMSFLHEVFSDSDYSTSHIFIATHSHFLISDLKRVNSKIIGLKKINGKIEIEDLLKNYNTFGWSAEEVLLKVFNVVTSRNYYVAEKLGLLLDFIADDSSKKDGIKKKFYELGLQYLDGLTDEDPLKFVYDKILSEYINDKA